MTDTEIRGKLTSITAGKSSGWLEKAKTRRENRAWLKRSQAIALRVLRTLRKNGITQKEFSARLDVSPQQISKIVKGKENLTLETISKIEKALGISLMDVPLYEKSQVVKASEYFSKTFYTKKAIQRTLDYNLDPKKDFVCDNANSAA